MNDLYFDDLLPYRERREKQLLKKRAQSRERYHRIKQEKVGKEMSVIPLEDDLIAKIKARIAEIREERAKARASASV